MVPVQHRHADAAQTPTPLPLEVEQITAAWLGEALSTPARRVEVDEVTITEVVPGTATKVRVEARYGVGDPGLPTRMCVKGGFDRGLRGFMGPGYQAEARFYRDVAGSLDGGLAACHFAGVDPAVGQGIVILDDLVSRGATFANAVDPLTVDQAGAALELLAAWHRCSVPEVDWLAGTALYRAMASALISAQWDGEVGDMSASVAEALGTKGELLAAFEELWADEDRRPRRFVHGDANLTNLYHDECGSPHFLDWQFAARSDAYHDVAFFLIGALDPNDRRAAEEELLRTYLSARGADSEPFDVAWDAYRRQALYGIIYALTPEQMQPAAIRGAMADRFAQAVLDHRSWDLLLEKR